VVVGHRRPAAWWPSSPAPTAVWRSGRPEELERFLQVAIAALLEGQLADDGLRRKLVRLSERAR